MPDISISNIAWEVSSDEQVASLLQRLGISWIDLAPTKYIQSVHAASNDQCQSLKQWWLQRGIRFAGMQALFYGTTGLNLFASPAIQQDMLDHIKAICRLADVLDARRLVFGSPRNRDRSGLADDQAFSIARDFFLRAAEIASSFGVTLCLEPNPPAYGCNFMTTTAEAAAVVEAVNHPAIRLQFDTGALTMNGEDPATISRDYGHLIGHVHLSEPQLLPLGLGGCDHRACAAALAMNGSQRMLTIEMTTRTVSEPLAAIERAVRLAHQVYAASAAADSDP